MIISKIHVIKNYLTKITKYFLVLLCLIVLYSSSAKAEQISSRAILEGSLSNQKLINDAMIGVEIKVLELGCKAPETFITYVSELPQGKIGSRTWQEIWVVSGCNQEYPITINFKEDGEKAAFWSIKPLVSAL